jgi:hypothetical protein
MELTIRMVKKCGSGGGQSIQLSAPASLGAQPDTATNARCFVRTERRIQPAGMQPASAACVKQKLNPASAGNV